MAIFTPDRSLIALADLVGHELAKVKPFDIGSYARTYSWDRLVGTQAHFSGNGIDRATELRVSFIKPDDPRAVEAVTCDIRRGEKTIYVDHYLTNSGLDSTFMSNFTRLPTNEFIASAISKMASFGTHPELAQALAGGEMVDVPFDYGENR